MVRFSKERQKAIKTRYNFEVSSIAGNGQSVAHSSPQKFHGVLVIQPPGAEPNFLQYWVPGYKRPAS